MTYTVMVKYRGVVQKGGGYGSRLGFPTANIPLDDAGASGIFAAHVKVEDVVYDAAAYADQRNNILESHLLDFNADLYGKNIDVELVKKLREEQRFESEDEARKVIAADILAARRYFNRV